MGRKSRAKRERRIRARGPIIQTAKGVSPASLMTLLDAASASPTASQSLPSLALIFESVVKHTKTGDAFATADLLPKLVNAAHKEKPELRDLEDFLPHDVRSEVVVRWRDNLYRLLPGLLERPVATIQSARLLAQTIDPVLVERLGYGLADAVELILRRGNHVASKLAPTWCPDEHPVIGAPPMIRSEELSAANKLKPISDQAAQCKYPDRTAMLLQDFSVPRKGLIYQGDGPHSVFGPTIAIRLGRTRITPIPAGLMMTALNGIASALIEKACGIDATTEEHWQQAVAKYVTHLLGANGHPIRGEIILDDEMSLHSLVEYSPRQILAIDVVAGLQGSVFLEKFKASSTALDLIEPDQTYSLTDDSTIHLEHNAEIKRLQIVAPDRSIVFDQQVDTAVINLSDLRWFIRTSTQCPVDLWYYFDDFLDNSPNILAYDAIDIWEHWRESGKVLYRGGKPFDKMLFRPHRSITEWNADAADSELEKALLSLQLPGLIDWPCVGRAGEAIYISDPINNHDCFILPWEIPVGLSIPDSSEQVLEDRYIILHLMQIIIMKLKYVCASFCRVLKTSGMKACKIEFISASISDSRIEPHAMWKRRDQTVTINCVPLLKYAMHQDISKIEEAIGRILAKVAPSGSCRDAFLAAWCDTPSGMQVNAVKVAQQATVLPDPIRAHESDRSAILRQLGQYLYSLSVACRTYDGNDARCLVSETIYPWFLSELHNRLHEYDGDKVLQYAIEQLEFVYCKRWWNSQDIAILRGLPIRSVLSEHMHERERQELLLLTKSVSLIIEEVIARPPNSINSPDEMLWSQLLNIAELCVESSLGIEALHFDLSKFELVVSDHYEVHFGSSDDPPEIDVERYMQELSKATLPSPKSIFAVSSQLNYDQHSKSSSVLEQRPDLCGIDSALRDTWNFGLDALILTIVMATEWPVKRNEVVTSTEVDTFIEAALEREPSIPEEEYKSAVNWLTLRKTDILDESGRDGFIEHWEVERRGARVGTRLFIANPSGIFVLPWTAEATLQIFCNYIDDGRLPWPARVLKRTDENPPGKVVRALQEFRQKRNRLLESECISQLRHPRLILQRTVKPNKRQHYGLSSLSGEIDVICINPKSSTIWVIEVKDPYYSCSTRSVRRLVDQFHQTNGYINKLLKKVQEVANNAQDVARALGAEHANREWLTQGLMVTKYITSAAFVMNSRVPFCTVDKVRDVVLGELAAES